MRRIRSQLALLSENTDRLKASSPLKGVGSSEIIDDEEQAGTYVALGGVSEMKIRSIRAQFGYQLFSKGFFSRGLFHLLESNEPPAHVIALFPHLVPDGR